MTQQPQTAATFWARVRRPLLDGTTTPDPGVCWLFRGAPNPDGYGMCAPPVGCSGSRLAHRIAWELVYREVPPPLEQTCGNRLCCNPNHLRPAKHREKVRVKTLQEQAAEDFPDTQSLLGREAFIESLSLLQDWLAWAEDHAEFISATFDCPAPQKLRRLMKRTEEVLS